MDRLFNDQQPISLAVLAAVLMLLLGMADASAQSYDTAIPSEWLQQKQTFAGRHIIIAGNAVKQTNQAQQSAKKAQVPKGGPYGKLPKTSDGGQHKDVINRRPLANQYDKLPTQSNGVSRNEGDYGRIPKGGPYGKLPKTSDSVQHKDVTNRRPPAKQYDKLPTQTQGSATTTIKRLPPKLGVRATPNQSTKVYPTLNLSERAKELFSKAIIKPFKALKGRITHQHSSGMDPNNTELIKPRPKPNSGVLGEFLGGGANALVYKDPQNPNYVRKLVRIAGPDIDTGSPTVVDLPENINVINDQMAGREILNRFKQTHQNKLLGKVMEVADVNGEPTLLTVTTRHGTHKFVQTVEQNISSPVYYKDAKGRALRVLDENGKSVNANSAIDRIEIRAKNKKRLEALAKGNQLKLKDIKITPEDIKKEITPNEALAINAVVRGLNKHGIVWTDHKMENFDIVYDPKSPLRHKVKFFDFDGFRVVKGETVKRSVEARKLQYAYDNDTNNAPADDAIQTLKKLFDYTATGGFVAQAATPHANDFRTHYKNLNKMNEGEFNQQLQQYTQGRVKSLSD